VNDTDTTPRTTARDGAVSSPPIASAAHRRSRTLGLWLGWAAVVGLAAVLVPAMGDAYYESLAVSALVLVVMGTGWNIVGGYGGQLSFGHAAFYGLGAYAAAEFVNRSEMGSYATATGAIVVAALVGATASLLMIPGYRSRGAYFAILTLAVAQFFLILGPSVLPGGSQGVFIDLVFDIDSHGAYWTAVTVAVLAVLISLAVRRSRLGSGLFAIRDDMDAAASVGVPTFRIRLQAFAISGGVTGAAGGLYATTQFIVDAPTVFSPMLAVLPVLIVTLGGIGTVAGPVIGALIWSVLEYYLTNSSVEAGYSTLVYGSLLVILAIALPKGLLGVLTTARAAARRRLPAATHRGDA